MKVKNKIIVMTFIIVLLIIGYNINSNAVSAKLSASATNVMVGTPITITINISGAAWSINVTGAVTGSYVDNTDDAENTNITKTLSFTPDKAGSYVVKLNGNVTGSTDTSATTVSDSVTINVKEKENQDTQNTSNTFNTTDTTSNTSNTTNTISNTSTNNNTTTAPVANTTKTNNTTTETNQVETKKSSNANISSLWITPREYDFTGSKANVLVYNTKVPNDVEEITIGGTTEDSKAKFTAGIGKKKLQVGNNSVKVEVTAEDGNKKTYTINITREEKKAEEENKTENTISQQENTIEDEKKVEENDEKQFKDSDLVKLEVKGYNISPEYSPDVYEYRMNVDDKVERLDVIAQKKDSNVDIEIAGNTELKDGENVITILVNNKKTNKNATYQIIVNKLSEVDLNSVNQALDDKIKESENNKKIVIGAIIGVNALIIIFILIKNIFSSDDEEYDIEENEEEDADDNDGKGEKVENLNLKENENKTIGLNKNMNENYEEISNTKHRKKGKHF